MISRVALVVAVAALLAGCSAAGPTAGSPTAPASPPVSVDRPALPEPGSPEEQAAKRAYADGYRADFTSAVCGEWRLPEEAPHAPGAPTNALDYADLPTPLRRVALAGNATGAVDPAVDGPRWGLDIVSWYRGDVATAKQNSPACQGR